VITRCFAHLGCGPARAALGLGAMYTGIPVGIVGSTRARDAKLEIRWLTTHGPAPMAAADWQRERQEADHHKSIGRKVMISGIGVALAGIAIGHHGDGRPGYFTFMAGSIASLGGLSMVRNGGLSIRLLKAHPPAGVLGAYPGSHVERSIAFNPGSATSIAYRV